MSTTSVRIDGEALEVLRALAKQQRQSIQAVLKDAINSYSRQRFIEEANASYAALRNDPEAWAEELEERKLWDRAIADGLEED